MSPDLDQRLCELANAATWCLWLTVVLLIVAILSGGWKK